MYTSSNEQPLNLDSHGEESCADDTAIIPFAVSHKLRHVRGFLTTCPDKDSKPVLLDTAI